MYDWPEVRKATAALWQIFGRHFQNAGFRCPETLSSGANVSGHWLHPDLFFSQTCGYPFATRLRGKVQLLATPHYAVDGCEGPTYSSALIVHRDADIGTLEQTKMSRFAFSGRSSLSAFRCLTPVLAQLGRNQNDWFGEGVETGGHRTSGLMIAQGKADVAALDAVCWHLFRIFEPEAANKVRVLCWTPQLPSLPYITRLGWDNDEIGLLRQAALAALEEASRSNYLSPLAVAGGSFIDETAYMPVASY